jgi:hypothetical protein
LLPGPKETVDVTAKNNRPFVEAVLYLHHAGIPLKKSQHRYANRFSNLNYQAPFLSQLQNVSLDV